jgi:hypothetical protein
MIYYILGCVAALAIGIYVGLGFPGLPGREDRVVPRRGGHGRVRRYFTPMDMLRPPKREGERRFLKSKPDPD